MGYAIINDKYRVDVEVKNLTLQKFTGISTNQKTGEQTESWSNEGYFRDWDDVLEYLYRVLIAEKIKILGNVNISELGKIFLEVRDEIKSFIKPMEA